MATPPQGEILKLGPPAAGEAIITVDPSRAGTSFAAGTQALVSRAEISVHRHLDRDEMLFVYKGQGRAILGEQTIIVVPGVTFHVPRGTWFSLRNTGTGALQFVWVSSPGLEAFFRDLSRLGTSPSAQAFQELAHRHGIELRQAAAPTVAAPTPAGHRRRRRRGGRRHRGERRAAPSAPRSAPSPAPQPSRPDAVAQRSPRRGRHRRKIKEVYMGGRWIQVEGEGPVIAPGRGHPGRKRADDDEPHGPPLAVPL